MGDRSVLSEEFRSLQIPANNQADAKQSESGQVIPAETARNLREASVRHWQLPPGIRHLRGKRRQSIICLLLGLLNGMTLAEVQAILGGPPGDYTHGRYGPEWLYTPAISRVGPFIGIRLGEDQIFRWTTSQGHIEVLCDSRGEVRGRFYDDVVPTNRSGGLLDWFRALLLCCEHLPLST
jgi:hypothetical protein